MRAQNESGSVKETFSNEVKMDMISSVPCYCDIQFVRKEFLTVLKYPEHPFTKRIEMLLESLKQVSDDSMIQDQMIL